MGDVSNVVRFVRVGGLFSSFIVVIVTWFIIHLLTTSQTRLGLRYTGHRLLFHKLGTILRFVVYLGSISLCIALSLQLTNEMMLALGGTIAVTVGFALKDLAASIIAGITILLDKPFQVGDRVSFGGFYGEIVAIGLRSVQLTTLDDNLVTIPNNKFLTDIVACGNAGELNMLIQMDFYIGIDQDLRRAKSIVSDSITSCHLAYLEKPWTVLVNQAMIGNYLAVRLRAKVYVTDVRYEKALETDVTERVLAGFRVEGIAPPAFLVRGTADPARAVIDASPEIPTFQVPGLAGGPSRA